MDDTGFPEHLGLPDDYRYKRFLSLSDLPERPPRHCRWCGQQVQGGRRSWCSDECVTDYQVRSWSNAVAHLVFERDQGICSKCGINTKEVFDSYRKHERCLFLDFWHIPRSSRQYRKECRDLMEKMKIDWGPWYKGGNCSRFWEADHIVPVIEGGGCCGLQNYRTLCLACHKAETAKLSSRRAEDRDPQMRLMIV